MRWLLLPLLLAPALGAAEAPRLEIDGEGRLALVDLPQILADEGVEEHLTTGLTTSFHIRLRGRGADGTKLEGGARVDVRYELWDEVFHVAAWEADGSLRRETVASREELFAWWRGLRLAVLDGAPATGKLRVEVDVVPFSQSETDDAQRWLTESLARSGTDEVGRSGEKRSETLSRTLGLLLATSIRRRALLSYRWQVPVPGGPR